MNRTVEFVHDTIEKKIEILTKIAEMIQEHTLTSSTKRRFDYHADQLRAIQCEYGINVINILSRHHDNKVDTGDYEKHITQNDYWGKLVQCEKYFATVGKHIKLGSDFSNLLNESDNLLISTKIKKDDFTSCACGGRKSVFPDTSEVVCNKCGNTEKLHGAVFEDIQLYCQEGQRSKHGCYDPSRHCRFWVQRIQARERVDIPQECINKVTNCINRDGFDVDRFIRCSRIRLYLKETRFTEYNNHTPLIRSLITRISPPQLTKKECRILYNIFNKCVDAYETTKPANRPNTIYYPYIIYKILDSILPKNHRKKEILECVHLQNRTTLISHDNDWKKICSHVREIKYKPTDRADQL